MSNNIYILNFLTTKQITEVMKMTDVNLFAYRSVTQSGVFFTSLAHSVPVIAYDLPGFAEFLNCHEVGLLVDNQNSESFIKAMEVTINNPDQLNKSKENISKYKDRYSWKNTVKIYEKLYQKI